MSSKFDINAFPDSDNLLVVLDLAKLFYVNIDCTFSFKLMSWQVLIANAIPSESDIPSSSAVEAPLTIGISNSQSSRANLENPQSGCLLQEMYVAIPISIQRQPISSTPAVSTEVFDVNGAAGGNAASRKRRKPWSKAEDMELIAAVQKCGEGNWANILKGDFKGNRTASQLSQVCSFILSFPMQSLFLYILLYSPTFFFL